MAGDPNVVEQAISRALRENLSRIQRGSEDLQHTINDLVAACASSRPTNAWPSMVRAQVSAASLASSLEVLMRFIAATLQPPAQLPGIRDVSLPMPAAQPAELPKAYEPLPPVPMAEQYNQPVPPVTASAIVNAMVTPEIAEAAREIPLPESLAPVPAAPQPVEPSLFIPQPLTPQPTGVDLPLEEPLSPAMPALDLPEENQEALAPAPSGATESTFEVSSLSADLQELHRRAYRVAKVTMQDIKMIHPDAVRLGRENKDLCVRLRDDIEKAHREYIRRFDPILSHPVDYFYDWMVQILAEGDPTALGEYPYPSAVLHR